MSTVIRLEGIAKKYIIEHQAQDRYSTLRDTLACNIRRVGNRILHPLSTVSRKTKKEEFWALKDISFNVEQGDRIGIIGRNGAGKSTLLKILSRITTPTKGRAVITGRIASLLEVGTGFHPELTGRENIFLNGAILGMSRKEIKRKFDEIVDFAEVEKFLDTPVKRYSSGMYVRLAFAVAAHMETDILIVDEVLSVGDIQFQKKCIGKMEDVSDSGRTILFVSHNLAAVENLSTRVIALNRGEIDISGSPVEVIDKYIVSSNTEQMDILSAQRKGNGKARIREVNIVSVDKNIKSIRSGADIEAIIKVEAYEDGLSNLEFSISVNSQSGTNMMHFSTSTSGVEFTKIGRTTNIQCRIKQLPLRGGVYSVNFFLASSGTIVDWLIGAYRLVVEDGDFFGTGKLPPRSHSAFLYPCDWKIS